MAAASRQLWLAGLRAQLSATLSTTGLPIIYSTEHDQVGASFGDRLQGACQRAFATGYEHLVVIGGDCPGLRSEHLLQAVALLEAGHGVLGRDLRGGVYLMGLSRAGLDTGRLAELPYRAPGLAKAFCELLHDQHQEAPVELTPLGDVHRTSDLRREIARLKSSLLRRLARALPQQLASKSALWRARTCRSQRPGVGMPRRGPPALVPSTPA